MAARCASAPLTTHAELARRADVERAAPALAEAAAIVGDPAVRNRGTIGGNVAHADPASDLPTVLVALEARMHDDWAARPAVRSRRRQFFTGIMTTDLADDEILAAIEMPARGRGESSRLREVRRIPRRDTRSSARPRVHLGAGRHVRRGARRDRRAGAARPAAAAVERALHGQALSTRRSPTAAASRAGDDLGDDVTGDIFASADYRRAMAPVYVKRALARRRGRAASLKPWTLPLA